MFWRTILVSVVFFAVGTLGWVTETRHQIIREQCQQSGNSDKLDELVAAVDDSMKCIENTFDLAAKNEMREVMITGGLKQIFKGLCSKSSQLKTCMYTLANGLSLCTSDAIARKNLSNKKYTDEIIDYYVFYNDGERMVDYILETGSQCSQEKSTAKPVRQALANMSPAEQCAVVDNLLSCMLDDVRHSNSIPTDLMVSIMQLALKSFPCK